MVLTLCALSLAMIAFTQSPKDHWYFGTGNIIHFENNEPQVKQGASISSFLGSVAMSDSAGNLLFYTNGNAIVNRDHEKMPGGSQINFSGSIDVIALPSADENIYFVYSINHLITLYVVDMEQNNGLGDVVHTAFFYTVGQVNHVFDGITAVKNCATGGYWLINLTDNGPSDILMTWEVDKVSGTLRQHSLFDTKSSLLAERLEMTTSPDGSQIVVAGFDSVAVFDFDTDCGIVTGMTKLNTPFENSKPMGACYSPSGQYLFLSYLDHNGILETSWLYQLNAKDLRSPNAFDAGLSLEYQIYGLLNGPDERMYISTRNLVRGEGHDQVLAIDRVKNPDAPFTKASYEPSVLEVEDAWSFQPFPNFMNDNRKCIDDFGPELPKTEFCLGDHIALWLKPDSTLDSAFLIHSVSAKSWSMKNDTVRLELSTPGEHYYTLNWSKCGLPGGKPVVITAKPVPEIRVGDTSLCKGDSLALVQPPDGVLEQLEYWQNDAWTITTTTSNSGEYKLTLKENGCTASDSFQLAYQSPLLNTLREKTLFCPEANESVTLNAGKGFNGYKWFPTGDTTEWIVVRKQGDYYVVVLDSRGCSGRDDARVEEECAPELFIPNAFTPNGDGVNDSFFITGHHAEVRELLVFDRWGSVVFASDPQNQSWNGMHKGEPLPVGTYQYVIRYAPVSDQDREETVSGKVHLVR